MSLIKEFIKTSFNSSRFASRNSLYKASDFIENRVSLDYVFKQNIFVSSVRNRKIMAFISSILSNFPVISILEQLDNYCLIGGLAFNYYSKSPRSTADVDVVGNQVFINSFKDKVPELNSSIIKDGVNLTSPEEKIDLDVMDSALPHFKHALSSATRVSYEGHNLYITSVAALIITKLVVQREKDLLDMSVLIKTLSKEEIESIKQEVEKVLGYEDGEDFMSLVSFSNLTK